MLAGASALLGLGAAAIRSGADDPCGPWNEASRALDLSRAEHRSHLAGDLAAIEQEAREFSAAVARRPLLSDSIDARAGAVAAPGRARTWCAAVLTDRVAAVHAVPAAHLRRLALESRHAGGAMGEARGTASE